ncbi:MAG: FG-GAP-like repeat-containing protein [Thermoanaerobaculia bacterium]
MRRFILLSALAAAVFALFPSPAAATSPDRAAQVLSLKNRGLAELEEGKDRDALASFRRLSELVPEDALPPADAAVAALRAGDLPEAEKLLARAMSLGPASSGLYAIGAAIESAKNDAAAARGLLAKAASISARDLESRWRWIRSAEIDPAEKSNRAETARYLQEILRVSPSNLAALLKLLLVRLDSGETDRARESVANLEEILSPMDARVSKFFAEGRDLLRAGSLKEAGLKFRIVENLLRVTDRYRQSVSELYTDVVGLPLESFGPAFEASLRPRAGAPVPVRLIEKPVRSRDLAPETILRRVDLANSGKPQIYDVPASYRAAEFLDFDLDGDLDVYLDGSAGPDRLLRNNRDGTWTDVTAATGDPKFSSLRVVATDFDRDGDPDLVAVTSRGDLVVRSNLRQGRFQTLSLGVTGAVDVAAADLNADGLPDLVVATKTSLVLLVNKGEGKFERAAGGDLAKLPAGFVPRCVAIADLDNDGFSDILVGGEEGLIVYRNAGLETFTWWPIAPRIAERVDEIAAVDFDGDGDLDVALSTSRGPRLLENEGGSANNWLDVILQGLASGSGKVNRAGVGSLVEVKAGDLYVAQAVTGFPTHFGIGKRSKADVVRCVWTNGVPQNLFDQRARATIREVQQLKGSCPFVYARNGSRGKWSFVSDALGRAPLGLLYDGVHLAGADPREWLKISGEMLSPGPDGRLEIDYTEELWEAAFLDMARLIAVDHPAGTDFVPNERTVPGILEKKIFTVARPRPVRGAWEDGKDVARLLARDDGRYVSPGRATSYQGVRTEHALTLDLGPLSAGDRVRLFLSGWIFYTDTSINVSLSQRHDMRPYPPRLEVPDGKGGWKVAIESFGFPAGKTKTMPVDLTGIVEPSDPRVRIRTTMEIYWDRAYVTVNDPPVEVVTTELAPSRATLSERGFSRRYRETADGPELFDHDEVSLQPHWPDVPGSVTRYGDVTRLLSDPDDRWVAFVGGDAIRIDFDARRLPALPAGWRRDFILVSDGWDKDFDKNTVSGATIGPYPFHAMSRYPFSPPEAFPDRKFLEEWVTRRVSSEKFYAWVREYGGEAIR